VTHVAADGWRRAAAVTTPLEVPPPELRYRRPGNVRTFAVEAWRSRGFVAALVERSLRARYKKSLLGPTWAICVPVSYVVVFSVFFHGIAKIATKGVPYPLFAYTALVPWSFFASGLVAGATSVVDNLTLVNKIAAPREVYPISALVTAAVDTTVAACVLPVLFAFAGRWPSPTVYWVPVLAAVEVTFTLGAVLVVAAVLPYLRDLRQVVPFATQLLVLATPVGYGLDSVPHRWRLALSLLNPLAPGRKRL